MPSVVFGGLLVPYNETICSCEEITPLNTLEYILKIKLSRGYGRLGGERQHKNAHYVIPGYIYGKFSRTNKGYRPRIHLHVYLKRH